MPVLAVALRSVADVAAFSPNSAVFALVLGISVLGYGILALALIFLGCAYGPAFLAPSTYPTLRPLPAVAGFVGFSCGPPLVVPECVWVSFWGGGAVSSLLLLGVG